MAYKLLSEPLIEKSRTGKKFTVPNFNGKIGFSIFVGGKEIFIGVCVADVEIEQVVRRKLVPVQKAGVKVFQLD